MQDVSDVVDVVPETEVVETPESMFADQQAKFQEFLRKIQPKWYKALTEYQTEEGETRRFIDLKKLERNKYAPWGRGDYA